MKRAPERRIAAIARHSELRQTRKYVSNQRDDSREEVVVRGTAVLSSNDKISTEKILNRVQEAMRAYVGHLSRVDWVKCADAANEFKGEEQVFNLNTPSCVSHNASSSEQETVREQLRKNRAGPARRSLWS